MNTFEKTTEKPSSGQKVKRVSHAFLGVLLFALVRGVEETKRGTLFLLPSEPSFRPKQVSKYALY
jgi:hypothetical protein